MRAEQKSLNFSREAPIISGIRSPSIDHPLDTEAMGTILVVDDEAGLLQVASRFFGGLGWTVLTASNGQSGYEIFHREAPDVIVLDLQMPGIRGMDLLEIMRRDDPDVAVIMLTGGADLTTAVQAMRLGAENFLAKPLQLLHLQVLVEQAHEKVRLRRQNSALLERGREPGGERAGSIGTDELNRQIELVSRTDSTALLLGETGVGKTRVARMIHARSGRASHPFVDVNCAGLSKAFLETELFGHEKGAFTDAREQKRGLLEIADRGTIFLDEVGELSPELQPKLLKVLETRRFRRLGGTREIEVDIRLIAATNRNLEEEVRKERFREDLYYRLAVFPIRLSPLRERSRDQIATLAYEVLEDLQRQTAMRFSGISNEALEVLTRYRWPGNIRELRNVLERCLIASGGETDISARDLPVELLPVLGRDRPQQAEEELLSLREVERRHIQLVLQQCRGNRSQAAKILGISRRGMYDKLARLGLEEPEPALVA